MTCICFPKRWVNGQFGFFWPQVGGIDESLNDYDDRGFGTSCLLGGGGSLC